MRVGKIVSNKAGFPNVSKSGLKGILTLDVFRRLINAGTQAPAYPLHLFAPGLINNLYNKVSQYLDQKDGLSGFNYGLAAINGQTPATVGFPQSPVVATYNDVNGVLEGSLTYDFKEIPYMDMMAMLSGGDLLRITNIRLRYHLKFPSAEQRAQTITFFSENIFGRPDFQQLTISQYFDPETNKTPNNDTDYWEVVDIPVDFFASNISGLAINIAATGNSLDISQHGDFLVSFMVEHYFNHVAFNRSIL